MRINGTRYPHSRLIKRVNFPVYSLCSAVILALLSGGSVAEPYEWYLGVAAGSSTVDPDVEETGFKNTENQDTAFKLLVGKELSDQLSVEAFAADLGEAELINGAKVGYKTYGASVSLTIPSNDSPLSAYAKGGLAYTDLDSDVPIKDDSQVGGFVGFGGEIKAGANIAIRGEYEFYNVDAQLVSLGIVKRFGSSSDDVIVMRPRLPVSQPSSPQKVAKQRPAVRPLPNTPLPGKQVQIAKDSRNLSTMSGDNDRDGVVDAKDLCKNTPTDVQVSKIGCASFIGVIKGISFSSKSDYLNATTKSTLDIIAENLSKFKHQKFVIVGHADSSEGPNSKKLSLQRALTASRHLVSKGIPASQLKFAGAGSTKPLVSNATDEGKEKNRRLEIYRVGS